MADSANAMMKSLLDEPRWKKNLSESERKTLARQLSKMSPSERQALLRRLKRPSELKEWKADSEAAIEVQTPKPEEKLIPSWQTQEYLKTLRVEPEEHVQKTKEEKRTKKRPGRAKSKLPHEKTGDKEPHHAETPLEIARINEFLMSIDKPIEAGETIGYLSPEQAQAQGIYTNRGLMAANTGIMKLNLLMPTGETLAGGGLAKVGRLAKGLKSGKTLSKAVAAPKTKVAAPEPEVAAPKTKVAAPKTKSIKPTAEGTIAQYKPKVKDYDFEQAKKNVLVSKKDYDKIIDTTGKRDFSPPDGKGLIKDTGGGLTKKKTYKTDAQIKAEKQAWIDEQQAIVDKMNKGLRKKEQAHTLYPPIDLPRGGGPNTSILRSRPIALDAAKDWKKEIPKPEKRGIFELMKPPKPVLGLGRKHMFKRDMRAAKKGAKDKLDLDKRIKEHKLSQEAQDRLFDKFGSERIGEFDYIEPRIGVHWSVHPDFRPTKKTPKGIIDYGKVDEAIIKQNLKKAGIEDDFELKEYLKHNPDADLFEFMERTGKDLQFKERFENLAGGMERAISRRHGQKPQNPSAKALQKEAIAAEDKIRTLERIKEQKIKRDQMNKDFAQYKEDTADYYVQKQMDHNLDIEELERLQYTDFWETGGKNYGPYDVDEALEMQRKLDKIEGRKPRRFRPPVKPPLKQKDIKDKSNIKEIEEWEWL